MAGNGTVRALVTVGVGLMVLFGAGVVLGGIAVIALGAWMVGNGTQHDVARVAAESCEQAMLLRPDDDMGVRDALAAILIASEERDRGRPLTARERRDMTRTVGWVVPSAAAYCERADGERWVAAGNPAVMGRLVTSVLDAASSGVEATEIAGRAFVVSDLVFGTVDQTIVLGSDAEVVEEAVLALTADAAAESSVRSRLEAAIDGADGALVGERDGAAVVLHVDVITASRGAWGATLDYDFDDPEALQAAGDAFCAEMVTDLARVGITCTASVEDGRVHAVGELSQVERFIDQLQADDAPAPDLGPGPDEGAVGGATSVGERQDP